MPTLSPSSVALTRLHASTLPRRLPLHGVAGSRQIEQAWMQQLPPHALMQRAGLATARLACALAPHAQRIWIACGPGNNGGDGLQAAALLQAWGRQVEVTLLADPLRLPEDARAAHAEAVAAGVPISTALPTALRAHDLAIDALLGIGASRAPSATLQACIDALHATPAPVLAIDLPTGLDADSGDWLQGGRARQCVHADHTLSLLSLKPGLFTGHGRDAAGMVWWDDLGTAALQAHGTCQADAWLQGAALQPGTAALPAPLPHASHKGSFGDVCIVGGAAGMEGAAVLAARAALHAGGGRVYLGSLSAHATHPTDAELMQRSLQHDSDLASLPLASASVAAGCGGGTAIIRWLPALLQHSARLVLDADALNAIAADTSLAERLRLREQPTILTPHPLEAARLLGCTVAEVQQQRLQSACRLADRLQAMVVLKGSGSVVAAPSDQGIAPVIVHAGNARLATAGTGDVLAGCIAAFWAQAQARQAGGSAWQLAFDTACAAVQAHGHAAEQWPAERGTLTAGQLAAALQRLPG